MLIIVRGEHIQIIELAAFFPQYAIPSGNNLFSQPDN